MATSCLGKAKEGRWQTKELNVDAIAVQRRPSRRREVRDACSPAAICVLPKAGVCNAVQRGGEQ
jgi:hypothetical protein